MPGVGSRFEGERDDDGKVKLTKLLSYDVVADPSFKNATLKKWEHIIDDLKPSEKDKKSWFEEYRGMHPHIDYWDVPEQKPKVNPCPDLDPYGEENWDDDNEPIRQNNEWPNLLPVSMKIAAQTIGLDLVAVRPLNNPILFTGYVDFKYDDVEKPKGKQIFSEMDPYGEENWED